MIGTRLLLAWSMITPVYNVIKDHNTNSLFNNSQSVRVPRIGPGESYTGLMVERQRMSWWVILKGPVDDVMLRHYRACNIYREFSDAFYIMILQPPFAIRK